MAGADAAAQELVRSPAKAGVHPAVRFRLREDVSTLRVVGPGLRRGTEEGKR